MNLGGPVRSASGLDHYRHRATTGAASAPIIALHPWFGCWQFWLPVVELFGERDWVLVDLYSSARTMPADDSAFDRLAAAVCSLIEEVATGPVVLAGNSTGGLLAQTIAISGRPPLDALVLVGTGASAVGVPAPFRARITEWLNAPGGPDLGLTRAAVRSLLASTPDALGGYVDAVVAADYLFMSAVLRSVLSRDLTDQLPGIRVPTLVVRGELDAARTREHVRVLCAGIPDSVAVEITGAGHSPMVDRPEAFDSALREFLASAANRPGEGDQHGT
jgi:3-oxoadipate enol-lactonase